MNRAMNRQKGAWIWVAMAAITFASLARAQSSIENARAYAGPVMRFLAGTPAPESGALASARRPDSNATGNALSAALNLLPVFFIGLIEPLGLLLVLSVLSLGRGFPAPHLAVDFQRPPPSLA